MIAARRLQRSFADGLIAEEVQDLWEPWMRHADEVLNDDQLLEIIQGELSKRFKRATSERRATSFIPAQAAAERRLIPPGP